jgi:WD40 repeat protein
MKKAIVIFVILLMICTVNAQVDNKPENKDGTIVTSVAFSPDGRYALSGSDVGILKLWEINSGNLVRIFRGHSQEVTSVSFSPDGHYALSGSWDNTLKLWEIASGKEIRTFNGHTSGVESVTFSPDGRYALSGSSITFSPDCSYVLSGSEHYTLKLWEIASGREIRTFNYRYSVRSVAFSPDGKYALSGSNDATIKLWEVANGKEIRTFIGHKFGVNSVAFSPDGKYALSASGDDTIRLWDISSGKEIRSFRQPLVKSLAFSPDGCYALSGAYDTSIKIWDVNRGKELRKFIGHTDMVSSIAFSPDGRYVLSGSFDNTLKLWDTKTGEEIRTFAFPLGPDDLNLKGKINDSLDIHMVIKPSPKYKLYSYGTFLETDGVMCQYSGYYYYDKYAKKIPIGGYMYSDGYIHLWEYEKKNIQNGFFSGFVKDDKIIKGVWSNLKGDKHYSFYLFDSKMNPKDLNLNVPIDKVGQYDRIGSKTDDYAYLEIWAETDDKLTFEIRGYYSEPGWDRSGKVDGIAFYTNESRTRAEYFNKGDKLKINFKFSGKQVEITANDVICDYHGSNVKLVGTFKKGYFEWDR